MVLWTIGWARKREMLYNCVQSCDDLSEEEREELLTLLLMYEDVLADKDEELGRTAVVQHSIVMGDAPPIKQPSRPIPVARQHEVRKLLDEILQKDVIQPSASPWASPVVLVQKKDGTMWFCIDYRKLNAVTRKDAYPLPRIDETLEALGGSKWFSTLDLLSGYWQVEVSEQDRLKTAFSTREGLFEFKISREGISTDPSKVDVVSKWSTPATVPPDWQGTISDASEYGLGAVLSQVVNGCERVVTYASRIVNKAERKGRDHGNADALSRSNVHPGQEACIASTSVLDHSVQQLQQSDKVIGPLYHAICQGTRPDPVPRP
ncbi:hypothetical protein EMCRGX_G009353 [Ephydatia muelleri]